MLTETFSLFNDTNLTDSFNGFIDTIHEITLSDNPQDVTLYLGSLGSGGGDTEDRQLQAQSNPGVDNMAISIINILPEWNNDTNYIVGDCIEPVTPNGFRYRCIIAGTSHLTTEPVWSGMGGIGSIIVDNTVTWKKVSARHPVTEVTLALNSGDLGTNTPGNPLNIGNTIVSGTINALPIYVRIVNTVTTVSTNTVTPEIGLSLNSSVEREV